MHRGPRAGTLPGAPAQVYDTNVLTEDNELTLALLHLGYAILSPRQCLLETEVMTDWHALWHQRLRWKRGALENLIDYGSRASPGATGAGRCSPTSAWS